MPPDHDHLDDDELDLDFTLDHTTQGIPLNEIQNVRDLQTTQNPTTIPHQQQQHPIHQLGRRLPGPAGKAQHVTHSGWPTSQSSQQNNPADSQEFHTIEWNIAVNQLLNASIFDESHPLLKDNNTVKAALAMKQSCKIERLLVYVTSLQHTHSGESFIRLKDPTGSITGTLTSSVLDIHPNIRRGCVVALHDVSLLLLPPPHALKHLCIAPENVLHVVPRGGKDMMSNGGGVMAEEGQQKYNYEEQQQQQRDGVGIDGDGMNNTTTTTTTTTTTAVVAIEQQQEHNNHNHIRPNEVNKNTVDDLLDGIDDDDIFV